MPCVQRGTRGSEGPARACMLPPGPRAGYLLRAGPRSRRGPEGSCRASGGRCRRSSARWPSGARSHRSPPVSPRPRTAGLSKDTRSAPAARRTPPARAPHSPHSLFPRPPVNFCATWHQARAAGRQEGAHGPRRPATQGQAGRGRARSPPSFRGVPASPKVKRKAQPALWVLSHPLARRFPPLSGVFST